MGPQKLIMYIIIYIYIAYIYICVYIYISSRQIPLSSCYSIVMVIALGGALSLSRVLWKSAYSRSFHACIFLSLCIHFLSFSCHVPFIGIHFNSFSFHNLFMFIPMCIQVLSSSFHLYTFSFHFAFMSFHVLSKSYGNGSMAGPGDRVQQMVIAKLSLNDPSNIWHCSKEICHKTRERERERQKERKKERKKERQRERERERERASWMPNAMATAGNRAPQIEFPSSSFIGFAHAVTMHNSICFVYAKFNGLSSMVPGYRFWGEPITSQCFVHISDKQTPAILK